MTEISQTWKICLHFWDWRIAIPESSSAVLQVWLEHHSKQLCTQLGPCLYLSFCLAVVRCTHIVLHCRQPYHSISHTTGKGVKRLPRARKAAGEGFRRVFHWQTFMERKGSWERGTEEEKMSLPARWALKTDFDKFWYVKISFSARKRGLHSTVTHSWSSFVILTPKIRSYFSPAEAWLVWFISPQIHWCDVIPTTRGPI